MRKVFILLILIACNNLEAQANLDFFIQAAFKNNPQIKEFYQSFLNSKLERDLLHAENVLPKVSLTANYLVAPYFNNNGQYISTDPDAKAIGYDIGLTNGGLYSALVNVEKTIFNGNTIDALEGQIAINENSIRNNETQFKHEIEKQVTDQYLQTYLSMKLIDLENDILSYLSKEKEIAAKLKDAGLIKESDNLLLDIEIGNQANALNNARTQFRSNVNQLLTICGITDVEITRVDSVSLPRTDLLKNSSFLKKYEIDSLAVANKQTVFETKYQPQVSLFFNTGLNAVELEGIQRKFGMSAGVNFSLPLFDGNQKSITRQQSEISTKTISFYRDYFFSQLKTQRDNSLNRISSLKRNLDNLQSQINTYNRVITISKQEFEKGILSTVDYLMILKNFIDLKKNLVTTQTDYQLEISNYNYWNW